MSTPNFADPKARNEFFKGLVTGLASRLEAEEAAATQAAEPTQPAPGNPPKPLQINLEDLTIVADNGSGSVTYQGQTYPLPPEVAFGLAIMYAKQQIKHAPLLIAQDPETGLVLGVYRAADTETHDKVREKLEAGRLLSAVEEHYQLQHAEYEVIHYTAPDVVV